MPCSCGVCAECDWARSHVDELYVDTDTLIDISDLPALKPRQPFPALFSDEPTGYVEGDRDWVLSNLELCVQLLERIQSLNDE